MSGIIEVIGEEINFLVSNFKIIFTAALIFTVAAIYLIHHLRKKILFCFVGRLS